MPSAFAPCLLLLAHGAGAAADRGFGELTPLLATLSQRLPHADPPQPERQDGRSALAAPQLPWAAANVTVFLAAGKGVQPFSPAEPCRMPHNRDNPINVSLVGPFPRGLCCTGPELLANYNASARDALNMSVRFDGTVLSAFFGLDCTVREIHNGTGNAPYSSFIGNLSKCISGSIAKGSLEVGLSLTPVAAPAMGASNSRAQCPVLPPPAPPAPPAPPPPPPAPPGPPHPAPVPHHAPDVEASTTTMLVTAGVLLVCAALIILCICMCCRAQNGGSRTVPGRAPLLTQPVLQVDCPPGASAGKNADFLLKCLHFVLNIVFY